MQVGLDAAHQVVRSRRHRQRIAGQVEAGGPGARDQVGEPPADGAGIQVAQAQVACLALVQPPLDRAGDDVARGQLRVGVLVEHEALAAGGQQVGALAATASEIRKARSPTARAVGWNWTNSMSLTAAPAR